MWQLDPSKSAHDNLWGCIHVNVFAFKNRAARRGLRLTYDEWADIIQDVSISTYARFIYRLRRGKYNRKQSFFINVWSCMYMVFHQIVKKYLRDTKGEFKKIVWPNFSTVVRNTGVVLAMCAVTAVVIIAVDALCGWLVNLLVNLKL